MLTRRAARVSIATALTSALAASITACGDAPKTTDEPRRPDQPLTHIHALGVNPADRALLLGTHNGLFRAGLADIKPTRVGAKRRDTKALAVLGPDRFLGAGHARHNDAGRPAAGLLRTKDGGRSWDPLSSVRRADLHVLRAKGARVYGVNASDGRLWVSYDHGRRWVRRFPPAHLRDLVANPANPDHLVASAKQMLFGSTNAGRSWYALPTKPVGLLAWPTTGNLYLIDRRGTVYRSENAGRSWRQTGQAGGPATAFDAYESELYVALRDDTVELSLDRGRHWGVRTTG